jgi:hypothetical protein
MSGSAKPLWTAGQQHKPTFSRLPDQQATKNPQPLRKPPVPHDATNPATKAPRSARGQLS